MNPIHAQEDTFFPSFDWTISTCSSRLQRGWRSGHLGWVDVISSPVFSPRPDRSLGFTGVEELPADGPDLFCLLIASGLFFQVSMTPRPSSGRRERLWPEFKPLRKKVQPVHLRGLFRLRPSSEAFSMLARGAASAWCNEPLRFHTCRSADSSRRAWVHAGVPSL